MNLQDMVVAGGSTVNIDASRTIIADRAAAAEREYRREVAEVLEASGLEGLEERREDLERKARRLGIARIEAAAFERVMIETVKSGDLRLRDFGARRRRYRMVLKGGADEAPGPSLTADEVVEFLRTHQNLGYAPLVDIDGDENWRSVWGVRTILAMPGLEIRCAQSRDVLHRNEVATCSSCGRPHRGDLLTDGSCDRCRRTQAEPIPGRSDLGPQWSDLSSVLDGEGWRLVPAGRFKMGSPTGEVGRESDEVLHEVVLTRAFWVAVRPVTEALFSKVMEMETGGRSDYPRVDVSWIEAIRFCNAWSVSLGLAPCYSLPDGGDVNDVRWRRDVQGVRLLTEAEWEYAARGGCEGRWPVAAESELDRFVVYDTESIEPLGESEPNAFGLEDMLGTVWEWVWDGRQRYRDQAVEDPCGDETNPMRILRGGCFADPGFRCRFAQRSFGLAEVGSAIVGFRVGISASD